MSVRTFAGFAYRGELGASYFGAVFLGVDQAGREARIVHVDPRLSARREFGRALLRVAEPIAIADHPRIVALRTVGRDRDELVAITEAVDAPARLDHVLAAAGGTLAPELALAIGLAVLEGLEHLHHRDLLHGGVHPRSVLIDARGGVRLTDLGLAWALADAAAETEDPTLAAGLDGYVAPELAVGGGPSPATDVHGCAALLVELMIGRPPGRGVALVGPARLIVAIESALAADPAARSSGPTLRAELEDAIARHGLRVAGDAAIAGLAGGRPPDPRDAELPRGLTQVLDDLGGDLDGAGPGRPSSRGDGDFRHEPTPLPPPSGIEATSTNIAAFDAWQAQSERGALAADDARAAVDALIDEASEVIEAPAARPVARAATPPAAAIAPRPALRPAGPPGEPAPAAERRGASWPWLMASVFVAAGLGAIAFTQRERLRGGAADALADREEREAAARFAAQQAHPGTISITAEQADAAVWLSLGRTPLRSLALPSDMVHELRVELEGFRPRDVAVTAQHWRPTGAGLGRAVVEVALAAGAVEEVAAFPPEPADRAGGPRGSGVLQVASDPPGAEVWLLVGTTPTAELTGVEAGRAYDLKVLKDGFRPAFASIKAEDWFLAGAGSALRPVLTRAVSLEAARRGKGRPGPRR